MRIAPKGDFNSTENLPGTEHADPRDTEYDESSVEIDLGGCHFIGPSAALWCITYSLLAKMRGSDCVLLIPQHGDVSPYLTSRGVLQFLQNKGVMVDFREVPDPDWGRPIVPMSEFETEYEVEEAVNEADLTLMESGLSTPDIYSTVTNAFAELALNAVQHSESEVGAFGYIQFYKSRKGPRFVCAVADGGIGIRSSLEQNPNLRSLVLDDWTAIDVAMRERVSGTREPTRGMGLFSVAEDVRKANRQLVVQSGLGTMRIDEGAQGQSRRTKLFPGTLAYASIPC